MKIEKQTAQALLAKPHLLRVLNPLVVKAAQEAAMLPDPEPQPEAAPEVESASEADAI
jgi:hypothetical protein